MTDYYQAYGTVIALVIAGIALVVVAFTLNRLISPK
nr:NADH-quinone oxidoreductase subunit A [Euzebyaceae bacterium]